MEVGGLCEELSFFKRTVVVSNQVYKLLGDLIRSLVVREHHSNVLENTKEEGGEERFSIERKREGRKEVKRERDD